MEIPLLGANDIEVRVATVTDKGCSLLLYKNARVDMRILDELFTPFGWKRKHEVINNNLFCTVEIKDPETKEWISKQDVGTESYTEKEKGQASDAFKRACFNIGIGRELYTAPFIWIKKEDVNLVDKLDPSGKPRKTTYDNFRVEAIRYDEKKNISALSIKNCRTGKRVYIFNNLKDENK